MNMIKKNSKLIVKEEDENDFVCISCKRPTNTYDLGSDKYYQLCPDCNPENKKEIL